MAILRVTTNLISEGDVDPADFEKEYTRHVRALRKIGFNVNGQAATSTVASRDDAGELIPAAGAILHAQDVEDK